MSSQLLLWCLTNRAVVPSTCCSRGLAGHQTGCFITHSAGRSPARPRRTEQVQWLKSFSRWRLCKPKIMFCCRFLPAIRRLGADREGSMVKLTEMRPNIDFSIDFTKLLSTQTLAWTFPNWLNIDLQWFSSCWLFIDSCCSHVRVGGKKKLCSSCQNTATCPARHPGKESELGQYVLLSTSWLTELMKTRCKAKRIII